MAKAKRISEGAGSAGNDPSPAPRVHIGTTVRILMPCLRFVTIAAEMI
jgi:hypothetical protein